MSRLAGSEQEQLPRAFSKVAVCLWPSYGMKRELTRTSVFSSLLPLPQVVFALNQTLLQQESLRAGSFQIPYTTEDLIKHYNCGDLSSIILNHDTSQVSLATAALVLHTSPCSTNPCSKCARFSPGRPFLGEGQGHAAGSLAHLLSWAFCSSSLHHLSPSLAHKQRRCTWLSFWDECLL